MLCSWKYIAYLGFEVLNAKKKVMKPQGFLSSHLGREDKLGRRKDYLNCLKVTETVVNINSMQLLLNF